MINKIVNVGTPQPGLVQDDSNVPYCSADNLPNKHDTDMPSGEPVYYCPHLVQLELGELYEITILDDKCMPTKLKAELKHW